MARFAADNAGQWSRHDGGKPCELCDPPNSVSILRPGVEPLVTRRVRLMLARS